MTLALRLFICAQAIALSVSAVAEVKEFDFIYGAGKVGHVSLDEKADGSFSSTAWLNLASIDATSTLTGKFENDILTSFELIEKQGTTAGRIVYAKGKADVFQGDKKVLADKVVDIADKPIFSTLQFGMLHKALNYALVKHPGAKAIPLFNLNAFASSDAKVKSLTKKNITISGNVTSVDELKLDLGGLDIVIIGTPKELYGIQVPVQNFKIVRVGYAQVFEDPLAKYPELSQPDYESTRDVGVKMKTRDGATLVSDVVRPTKEGKYPVVLVRTPYGRAASALEGDFYAQRGYVYVAQDVRGKGDSTGEWDPFNREVADGKDTLDWLVTQPWCDGSVGMIGGSYLGMVQWAAAVTHHPALKCIIPQVSPPEPMRNVPWDHGSFLLLGNLWWARIVQGQSADMSQASANLTNLKALTTIPLSQVDDKFFGANVPFFDLWLKRDTKAAWTGAFTTEQVATVKIPVLHISGTWDGDGIGTLINWNAVRQAGGNQWLIFGPWEHGFNAKTSFGGVDYGSGSILELNSTYLRFFDSFLKEREVGIDKMPRVRMFVAGANQWITGSDWPLKESRNATWYLGGGAANGLKSKGTLGTSPSTTKDRYVYDPNKPRVLPESMKMDRDTSTVVTSELVDENTLIYRGPTFKEPIRFAGPMTAELYVSTSVRDATFQVIVCEEKASGEMRIIGMPGVRRITYTDEGTWQKVVPGKIYKVEVQPWNFAHEFAPGSRMVIGVMSETFPRYARNPGTGERDIIARKMLKATQTVYKDAAHPSKITFQVLP